MWGWVEKGVRGEGGRDWAGCERSNCEMTDFFLCLPFWQIVRNDKRSLVAARNGGEEGG